VDLAEYSRIAQAEEEHWWYRGTQALVRQLLAEDLRPGLRVLDAGCGPGGNSAWLAPQSEVVGIDASPEAIRLMNAVQGDIAALPFPDESFDLVLALTVLYLIEDDALATRELARVLRPGGAALLIEPANPWLRRDHDVVTHARRRYTVEGLRRLAEDAGLCPRRATYAYSFLLPPAMALAALHRVKPPRRPELSDLQRDRLGWLFRRLGERERWILRRRDIPFGLSAVVSAERPA